MSPSVVLLHPLHLPVTFAPATLINQIDEISQQNEHLPYEHAIPTHRAHHRSGKPTARPHRDLQRHRSLRRSLQIRAAQSPQPKNDPSHLQQHYQANEGLRRNGRYCQYETHKETDHLAQLKQLKKNQLEQQAQLKRLNSKSPVNTNRRSPKLSPSPSQQFEDIPTDRVVIKRLFQILDSDQDGLISQKKIDFKRIPNQLMNYLIKHLNQVYIPVEYEEFYELLHGKSQEEYFNLLKQVSEILEIPRIKVLL